MSTSDHDHKDPKPETGAQGDGSADAATPFAPASDDDSPVGSTDQHSKVSSATEPTPEEVGARDTGNAAND